LFVPVFTFGQVTGRFNNILLPAGTTTVTTDKVYNTNHDLYWNGEKISNWRTNGNSHIEPWPTSKKIYYPGMPSAAGQTLPGHYTPVYFNRYNNELTTFLVNGGGGGQIIDTDTLTGCQAVYNYSVDGQEVTIDIDSIYNICGCFYFIVTGENTTVTLQSIEGLLIGGTQTYTVTTGQNILICPDSTKFLVSFETDPIYSADSEGITARINLKRDLNNHDSLSKLDERSYESLTGKPSLSVTSDAPYSAVLTLDSSDVILTADSGLSLVLVGKEIKVKNLKRTLASLDERSYNSLTDKPTDAVTNYEAAADSLTSCNITISGNPITGSCQVFLNGYPLIITTQWIYVATNKIKIKLPVYTYDKVQIAYRY